MTFCSICNGYLMDADTCTADAIRFPDSDVLEAITYGEEATERESDRCPDCGVERGGYHHPGCEVAECPRCGEALAGCGCLDGA